MSVRTSHPSSSYSQKSLDHDDLFQQQADNESDEEDDGFFSFGAAGSNNPYLVNSKNTRAVAPDLSNSSLTSTSDCSATTPIQEFKTSSAATSAAAPSTLSSNHRRRLHMPYSSNHSRCGVNPYATTTSNKNKADDDSNGSDETFCEDEMAQLLNAVSTQQAVSDWSPKVKKRGYVEPKSLLAVSCEGLDS